MTVAMRQVKRARMRGPKFEVFRASNLGSLLSSLSRASRVVSLVQPNNRDRPDRPSNGLLALAYLFSILLMFQFESHSAQQMRYAKGLLEGLTCSEEVRDIQDIFFSSYA
jgi:hypothetical protein